MWSGPVGHHWDSSGVGLPPPSRCGLSVRTLPFTSDPTHLPWRPPVLTVLLSRRSNKTHPYGVLGGGYFFLRSLDPVLSRPPLFTPPSLHPTPYRRTDSFVGLVPESRLKSQWSNDYRTTHPTLSYTYSYLPVNPRSKTSRLAF